MSNQHDDVTQETPASPSSYAELYGNVDKDQDPSEYIDQAQLYGDPDKDQDPPEEKE
jgi:hypothetical protein